MGTAGGHRATPLPAPQLRAGVQSRLGVYSQKNGRCLQKVPLVLGEEDRMGQHVSGAGEPLPCAQPRMWGAVTEHGAVGQGLRRKSHTAPAHTPFLALSQMQTYALAHWGLRWQSSPPHTSHTKDRVEVGMGWHSPPSSSSLALLFISRSRPAPPSNTRISAEIICMAFTLKSTEGPSVTKHGVGQGRNATAL